MMITWSLSKVRWGSCCNKNDRMNISDDVADIPIEKCYQVISIGLGKQSNTVQQNIKYVHITKNILHQLACPVWGHLFFSQCGNT